MADVYKYLSIDGLINHWAKTLNMVDTKLLAKADNIAYSNNKLQLKRGATVLSEVTITTGLSDYLGLSNKPQVNGVELTGNKTLTQLGINIPTLLSQFVNDPKFQTDVQVDTKILTAIQGVTVWEFLEVDTLPATGETGKIYLIATTTTGSQNLFDEYIWLGVSSSHPTGYEKFGSNIDLSSYVLKTDLVAITNAEIDALTTV